MGVSIVPLLLGFGHVWMNLEHFELFGLLQIFYQQDLFCVKFKFSKKKHLAFVWITLDIDY